MITIRNIFLGLLLFSSMVSAETPDFSLQPDHTMQPASLVDIADSYPHVIISELSTGKLYVYKRQADGSFLLLETMHTSIGKKGYLSISDYSSILEADILRMVCHEHQPLV